MPDFPSREVLICLRVDEAVSPPAPSFNCQCQLCGARIWVAHDSPLEPARMCGACGTTLDAQVNRTHHLDNSSKLSK